jgi:hypothetical protein
MTRYTVSLPLILLALATQAAAQTYIGPNLSAPTVPQSLGNMSNLVFQSFRVTRPVANRHDLRFKFWFDGSTMGNRYYTTNAFFSRGDWDDLFQATWPSSAL